MTDKVMGGQSHTAPVRGPGHCDDDAAWAEFSRQYAGRPRKGDMTDFALANAVFMASRHDLDLIVYQTMAKERIRWLSLRLAEAEQRAAAAPELLEALNRIAALSEGKPDAYTGFTRGPTSQLLEAKETARAAIAKATGESAA